MGETSKCIGAMSNVVFRDRGCGPVTRRPIGARIGDPASAAAPRLYIPSIGFQFLGRKESEIRGRRSSFFPSPCGGVSRDGGLTRTKVVSGGWASPDPCFPFRMLVDGIVAAAKIRNVN